MKFMFYLCGLTAVITTLRFVTHINPVRALLYLICSLISIAGIFFSIGANFAGALEIIVYAGAIMVLFVFVVMILNLRDTHQQEREWLKHSLLYIIPCAFFLLMLFIIMVYAIVNTHYKSINNNIVIDTKSVGMSLFGPYILVVEFSSMLLIVGLIVAFHLGRDDNENEDANKLPNITFADLETKRITSKKKEHNV